jgi:hypothetical protein
MDVSELLNHRDFGNHFPEATHPVFAEVLGPLLEQSGSVFSLELQGNMVLGLRSELQQEHRFDVRFVPFARTHAMVSPHAGKITIYFGRELPDGRFLPKGRLALSQEQAPSEAELDALKAFAREPEHFCKQHPYDAIEEKREFLQFKQTHNLPLNIMERKFLMDHSAPA